MDTSSFEYRCALCGHTWNWAYLFVVRCPRCKGGSHFGLDKMPEAASPPALAGSPETRAGGGPAFRRAISA
jgi:hypothetical protein